MANFGRHEIFGWLRRKGRVLPIIGWSILLIALGTVTFVLGPSFGWRWGQTVGGIVFGAGLTVLGSTISSTVTVREQYAKEANLKRRDDYYGPLHADLKILRERLAAALDGRNPYPLWIAGADVNDPTGRHLVTDPPTLAKWSEFRSDYRIDNFTRDARRLLDTLIDKANEYNKAMDAARAPTKDTLELVLANAIQVVAQSTAFRDWQQRREEQLKASRRDPDDEAKWFGSLIKGLSPELDPSVLQGLASGWVDGWALPRPETLGWLLARRPDGAALCLDGPVYPQGSRPAAPPIDWRQSVFEHALAALDSDQTYEKARHAGQSLFDAVSIVEKQLADGLLYIRDHYEGGHPPV